MRVPGGTDSTTLPVEAASARDQKNESIEDYAERRPASSMPIPIGRTARPIPLFALHYN